MSRVLCRFGLHRWLELGQLSLIQPAANVFECLRCHRREARYGYGTIYQNEPPEGWNDYLELNWFLRRREKRD